MKHQSKAWPFWAGKCIRASNLSMQEGLVHPGAALAGALGTSVRSHRYLLDSTAWVLLEIHKKPVFLGGPDPSGL
jgi:hypothetical protein